MSFGVEAATGAVTGPHPIGMRVTGRDGATRVTSRGGHGISGDVTAAKKSAGEPQEAPTLKFFSGRARR